MRSASSFALRSASSKSIASVLTTFFAPSFWVFLELSILPFLAPAPVGPFLTTFPVRTATGGGDDVSSFSLAERGDLDLAPFPLAPAFKNGEAVRLAFDGVPTRDGGLLGRLMAGLSQEEKKSSSGSPAGVAAPSLGVPATSVTTTSPGNLDCLSLCHASVPNISTNGGEAYGRGLWSERRRYGHRGYDDETSSPGIGRYQKELACVDFEFNKRGFSGWRGDFTLFAGFVFNFSKIFCDCALVALMVIVETGTRS
ncbi:hypothetical protein TMatcc_007839 [Talaromyces marneffei ATCC 18224]